ncbi:MAG: hypothetical protein JNK43_11895 [Ignavibacteria bacterium]|nr:hypothetical protein [Ignavibacteria bacterium]
MKKTAICFILIFFNICSAHLLSQTEPTNSGYGLICKSADSETGLVIVIFTIINHGNVKIYSVEGKTGKIEMIVDGVISEGQHGIIYKILPEKEPGDMMCVMEIFEDNGNLIYKTQSGIY